MKKLIAMVIVILISTVLLIGFVSPKKGHVTIQSTSGIWREYDYVEIDGETIKYNEVCYKMW